MTKEWNYKTDTPVCAGCQKTPDEIGEYKSDAKINSMTPADYVLAQEGTLNFDNGKFLCTDCYIKAGCPSSPTGWIVPDDFKVKVYDTL